jgi:acyl carrier protein
LTGDVDEAIARIAEFLSREILAVRPAEGIDPDQDLVELGLDSLALLRLVLFLEHEYGVQVEGADILGEGLTTIRGIAGRCCGRGG